MSNVTVDTDTAFEEVLMLARSRVTIMGSGSPLGYSKDEINYLMACIDTVEDFYCNVVNDGTERENHGL